MLVNRLFKHKLLLNYKMLLLAIHRFFVLHSYLTFSEYENRESSTELQYEFRKINNVLKIIFELYVYEVFTV